jgi:hypothetical protein
MVPPKITTIILIHIHQDIHSKVFAFFFCHQTANWASYNKQRKAEDNQRTNPFALGLALFIVSTANGMRVARRGWGQMTSARGVGGESIGQNLDLLSGIASALDKGCLK